MALSIPSIYKYLEKRCTTFSRDFVYLSRVGRNLEIVLVSMGKLKIIDGAYAEKYCIDMYITKISEVCQGLPYDEMDYCQPYISTNSKGEMYSPSEAKNVMSFNVRVNVGSVVRMCQDLTDIDTLRKRTKYGQNLGFTNVGKVDGALSVEEWIAQNS